MPIITPPTDIVAGALRACRRHFVAVATFSALLNLLFLVPMLYMLQIYDRVIPTRGNTTLFFITLVLLFGLATLFAGVGSHPGLCPSRPTLHQA